MDDVALFSAGDRSDLFREAASRTNLSIGIIEKDFWVCWTLKRVFTMATPPAKFLFKGGTSLSKVYRAIDRFSEDVDISFVCDDLALATENDLKNAGSNRARNRAVESLTSKAEAIVRDRLLPEIRAEFERALAGVSMDQPWTLEFQAGFPPTIVFRYPQISSPASSRYLRSEVFLEFNALAEQWPALKGELAPYAAEAMPKFFGNPNVHVDVLAPARTFWEKATILHGWHHAPKEKAIPERQSRHFYDLARLSEHEIGTKAVADPELLGHVVKHKRVFFRSGYAKYDSAVPGTLRLVPPDWRFIELRTDYEAMREMFFSEPPSFDSVLAALAKLERAINQSTLGDALKT